MATSARSTSLERNAVGLPAVIFQSVATMAPGVGLAYSIGVGASFAGGALPLAVIFALIACLLVAVSVGQLAKHFPSAGGIATYSGAGINPAVGFVVGWGYAATYLVAVPFLMLLVGYLFAGVMQTHLGWSYDLWWVVASLLGGGLIFAINYLGVRLSTTVGVILGALEIVIFVLLSLTLLAKAGSANTLSTFGTAHANVKGFEGLPGVIAGSVYGILAFIGFEASAPLGEEARNPRRSVQLAVVGSCIMVGLFYVLGTYAASVFFGVDKMAGFTGANNGNPWTAMAESAWGVGWVIVFITLLNSGLANINGVANAGTRVLFNLGRARALPSALERTHPRFRSPHVAVIFYFVAGAIITLVLGKIYGPTTAYALLGTMAVALVIPTYAITCLASLVYYARQRRDEFNFVLHGVVPVLGILVLLPPLLAGLGVAVFSFISPLQYPLSLAGPIVAVVYLVGIVLAIYFTRTSPERLVETTRLYEEVTPAAVDGSRPMAPVR